MAHNKPTSEQAIAHILHDLYNERMDYEYIYPEEAECDRSWNDPLFQTYWLGLGMNDNLLTPEEQQAVTTHIAHCHRCAFEKKERVRIMQEGPILPLNNNAILRAARRDQATSTDALWQLAESIEQTVTKAMQHTQQPAHASWFAMTRALQWSQSQAAVGNLSGKSNAGTSAGAKRFEEKIALPDEIKPYFKPGKLTLKLDMSGTAPRLSVFLPELLDMESRDAVLLHVTLHDNQDAQIGPAIESFLEPGSNTWIETPQHSIKRIWRLQLQWKQDASKQDQAEEEPEC